MWAALLLVLAGPSMPIPQEAEEPLYGPEVIRVGHWVELRGALEEGVFVATTAELGEAEKYETLIGTVEARLDRERYILLGQQVHVSDRTEWKRMDPDEFLGARVKVVGRYRGPRKFSAREISPRGDGRDRITGRVDLLAAAEGGLHLQVQRFKVFLPADAEVRALARPATLPLVEPRVEVAPDLLQRVPTDEEDQFGRGLVLAENLRLSGLAELNSRLEENYEFSPRHEDRVDHQGSLRLRLDWNPTTSFSAVGTLRYSELYRLDEEDGEDTRGSGTLGETYGHWHDLFGTGAQLQVGRLDFDEYREWLYDQNLDAVRLILEPVGLRLELSLSTRLTNGSDRDENSRNFLAYLSKDDGERQVAAYVLHRDIDTHVFKGVAVDEAPTHLGGRLQGEWLPANDSWAEFAFLRGDRAGAELHAYGFDVGSTWSPDFLGPFSLTGGYAFGSGDTSPGPEQDRTFRQTGFQDNNTKWAGVTSFRYYGELFDPELANLQILTAGLGVALPQRSSLDVVLHHYRQDRPEPDLVASQLSRRPNGINTNLGTELDLIFGSRRWSNWDLELVAGWFRAGSAFSTGDDDAYLGRIQLRYRF